MRSSLRLSREARETIASLPAGPQEAVLNTILLIAADPWAAREPLRGRLGGLWSARVGSYRILYTIEGPEHGASVVIRALRHRAVAYRRQGR